MRNLSKKKNYSKKKKKKNKSVQFIDRYFGPKNIA